MRSTGEAGVCGAHTSLTLISRSPKLAFKSEWRIEHPVAARDGCTNIPLLRAGAQANENHSSNRHFRPWTTSVRPPDPPELIRSWKICESV
jgi:hypothetical protein